MSRKYICSIKECNKPIFKIFKVLIQHPTCRRWQSWKICKFHHDEMEIEKQRVIIGLEPRWHWHSIYYKKPLKRPVIEFGHVIDFFIDVI